MGDEVHRLLALVEKWDGQEKCMAGQKKPFAGHGVRCVIEVKALGEVLGRSSSN